MSKLYLFNYNNYFNRIVKKESSLSNYGTPIYTLDNTNFNYNDGVITNHVINYNGQDGDYLIITETVDNTETIASRWFVIENQRTRGGQHTLTLRRDLIVDNYDKVINAPMIVERAKINSIDNPLLYNPEGFSFNQIKKQEILLKDKIGKAWYVLYFKKGMPSKSGSFVPGNASYNEKIGTDLEHSIYASGSYKYSENEDINITYRVDTNSFGWAYFSDQYIMHNRASGSSHDFNGRSSLTSVIWFDNNFDTCKVQLDSVFANQFSTLRTNMLTDTGNSSQVTSDTFEELRSSNGKVILTSDNKLYRVSVSDSITTPSGKLTSGSTYDQCQNLINSTTLSRSSHFGDNTVGYSMTLHTLVVTTTEITSGTYPWTIDFSDCPCDDSDFDILAIPYGDTKFNNGNTTFEIKGSVNDRLVHAIMNAIPAATEENGWLVDVQLLPYCPDPNVMANSIIDVSSYTDPGDLTVHPRYAFNNAGSIYNNSFMLYIVKSNISFDITSSLSVKNYTGNSAIDYKVSNECELYKLVSPNYNGSFEFSLAKNQGVDSFNIDMTLKPYNPYIHVNPNFKALYGSDWNDIRGLVCGGDFSLPIYSSMWAQYELQNKNYQNIFDRQIRNLDFNQGQERIQEYTNLALGIVKGGSTGAFAGAQIGGGWGALIGGVLGTAGSAATGIVDANLMQSRQAEAKSFTLDNYRYQLGNIKALPDTINKVTPLTYNNKIWPFIEVYSATDEEKDLFVNYLTYRSMNVNAVGNITTYQQSEKTFIKGQLIRLEDLNLCTHEANEIYNEIMEGVYI